MHDLDDLAGLDLGGTSDDDAVVVDHLAAVETFMLRYAGCLSSNQGRTPNPEHPIVKECTCIPSPFYRSCFSLSRQYLNICLFLVDHANVLRARHV